MSDISERITAHILLADFVNIGSDGKANTVGAGLRIFNLEPNNGVTPPFGILVTLECPVSGDTPAFELLLTTSTGQVVKLPSESGSQAIRISQNIEFTEPAAPGVAVPKGALPSSVQFAINFSNGLPLKPGFSYQFRVQIDHDVIATYSIYVPRPATGAVLG